MIHETSWLAIAIFMAFVAVNAIFVSVGYAQLELIAPYGKNQAGVGERWIGAIFAINTLVIVIAQLPIVRLAEGRRRMRVLALMGVVWAASWLLVPVAGLWLASAAQRKHALARVLVGETAPSSA